MCDRANDRWLQDGRATGARAKPIRNDNNASVITYLKREKKKSLGESIYGQRREK